MPAISASTDAMAPESSRAGGPPRTAYHADGVVQDELSVIAKQAAESASSRKGSGSVASVDGRMYREEGVTGASARFPCPVCAVRSASS